MAGCFWSIEFCHGDHVRAGAIRAVRGATAVHPRACRAPADERSASSARGFAPHRPGEQRREQSVQFYQDLLDFPLTELIENRDYPGSSRSLRHGHQTCWRSSTFPAWISPLPGGPRRAAPPRDQRGRRAGSSCATSSPRPLEFAERSGVSLYFRDPDGALIELIADTAWGNVRQQGAVARQIGSGRMRLITLRAVPLPGRGP